jgi:hypothetical protein
MGRDLGSALRFLDEKEKPRVRAGSCSSQTIPRIIPGSVTLPPMSKISVNAWDQDA